MYVQLESTVDQLKKELASAKSAASAQEVNLKRQVAAFKAEHNAKLETVFGLIHFNSVSARYQLYRRSVTDLRLTDTATTTNGPRFTELCLPWYSPIQVLTEVDLL